MFLASVSHPHRVGLAAVLLLALPLSLRGSNMQTHIFDLEIEGQHQQINLVIESLPRTTLVTFSNEYGGKDVSVFENPRRPLGTSYYDPDHRQTAQSVYDYQNNRLRIKGDVNASYPIEGDIFDNNGALFYLFSIFYPEPGKKIKFKLVQCDLSYVDDPFLRMLITRLVGPVEMSFKHVRSEPLSFQEEAVETEVYALAIYDRGLAGFWPHKYYFWYDAKTRQLLQLHGFTAQKHKTIYRLVDFYEWKKPEPELPTL